MDAAPRLIKNDHEINFGVHYFQMNLIGWYLIGRLNLYVLTTSYCNLLKRPSST